MKWNSEEFYPTPKELLTKILADVDWRQVHTVLEPSAGKGDIVAACMQAYRRYSGELDIDCIELDEDLQKTLKGKEYRVVHDDFLTFHTFKHYDLIVMNPPFSQGTKHLMHALNMQMQEDNYGLICILNAETLKNPYSNERKALLQKLEDLDARIEYMQGQFLSAERPAGVEIAVIKVFVPEKERTSRIFENLEKRSYQETPEHGRDEVAPNDYLEAAVRQYNLEVEAGVRLILEYEAMKPRILDDLRDVIYKQPILQLKIDNHDVSTNRYVKMVRNKYWRALFSNPKFTGQMTSNLVEEYQNRVDELKNYDFSMHNIRVIEMDMRKNLIKGIEDCIIKLFDELSYEHSYQNDIPRNIHYYNGWKTNKSWYINKKVVIPYMNTFQYGYFDPTWEVRTKLADIEKALNYLDGGRTTDSRDINLSLRHARQTGQTKNIVLKYFKVTFYKKGTCHLEFLDEDLLKKLNLFGSQQKGWLPQGYGKKAYSEMNAEERAVVDEFEGKESYARTVAQADYFIYDPSDSLPMIGTAA